MRASATSFDLIWRLLLPVSFLSILAVAIARFCLPLAYYPYLTTYSFSWLVAGLYFSGSEEIPFATFAKFTPNLTAIVPSLLMRLGVTDILVNWGVFLTVAFSCFLLGIRKVLAQREVIYISIALLLSAASIQEQSAWVDNRLLYLFTAWVFGIGIQSFVLLTEQRTLYCSISILAASALSAFIFVPRLVSQTIADGQLEAFPTNADFFSFFHWPIVVFALLGLIFWRTSANRKFALGLMAQTIVLVCPLWILPSEPQLAFNLLLAVPVYYFAAEALVRILENLARWLPEPVSTASQITLLIAVLFANSGLSLVSIGGRQDEWRPYALLQIDALRSHLAKIEISEVEDRVLSEHLLELAKSMRGFPQILASTKKILIYESQPVSAQFQPTARNEFYFQMPVHFISTPTEFTREVATDNLILICRKDVFSELSAQFLIGSEAIVSTSEPFVAAQFRASELRAISSVRPNFVQTVKAREYPERLFDGVTHDPSDWTATTFEEPIEITFNAERLLSKIAVNLFDFDGRYYHFLIEYRLSHSTQWHQLIRVDSGEPRGRISLPTPKDPVTALRIVGLYNSHQAINPSNRNIHVTELELE